MGLKGALLFWSLLTCKHFPIRLFQIMIEKLIEIGLLDLWPFSDDLRESIGFFPLFNVRFHLFFCFFPWNWSLCFNILIQSFFQQLFAFFAPAFLFILFILNNYWTSFCHHFCPCSMSIFLIISIYSFPWYIS